MIPHESVGTRPIDPLLLGTRGSIYGEPIRRLRPLPMIVRFDPEMYECPLYSSSAQMFIDYRGFSACSQNTSPVPVDC
jgi:hypothetical protein